MALVVKDRVKETTTTTGTSSISLGGAVTKFKTFSSALSDGDTTYYAIEQQGNTNEFEVGIGTYASSGNTLARTTILSSSNSNNAVDFSAGTKNIFMTYPADKAVYEDASGNISIPGTIDGRDLATDGTKLDGIAANANNYSHPNHSGDVTSSGDGATTIANDAVTYAKIQNVSSNNVLLGNDDGAGSAVQELTAANVRTIINVEDGATADQTAAEIRTLVESASDSNVFTDADHSKLNAIEANATADQTASEILTAVKTVDGASSGLDADLLDGQEGSYYTNAANLTGTLPAIDGSNLTGLIDTNFTRVSSVNSGSAATKYIKVATIDTSTPSTSNSTFVFRILLEGRSLLAGSSQFRIHVRTGESTSNTFVVVEQEYTNTHNDFGTGNFIFDRGSQSNSVLYIKLPANNNTSFLECFAKLEVAANQDTTYVSGSDDVTIHSGQSWTSSISTTSPITASWIDKKFADLEVDGDITVSGTVDGVDIAGRNAVLTSTTTTANAAMPKAGGTFTGDISFEGATANDYETTLTVTDPTADRTITLPDETGTIALTSDINATNVTAAGALMDSEVTNLAQVKAFDSSDYATAAQGSTADAAMPKAGGTFTGDVTFSDNEYAKFGTDEDVQIGHNGNGLIRNYTNDLYITNYANDRDVLIMSDNSMGGTLVYFRADGSTGNVDLFHYGNARLSTTSAGVDVTGNITVSGTVDGKDVSTLTTATEAADEATALAIALG